MFLLGRHHLRTARGRRHPRTFPPGQEPARGRLLARLPGRRRLLPGHRAALSVCTGPIHASERSPAWSLFARADPSTVFVGDGNFGIYGVVKRALHYRLDVVFRLTDAGASALLAGRRKPFSTRQTPVWWSPSKWDKPRPQATPFALPGRALIRLLRGDGSRDMPPWLFTALPDIPARTEAASRQAFISAWPDRLDDISHFRLPDRKKHGPSEPRRTRHKRGQFPKLTGSRAAARAELQASRTKC